MKKILKYILYVFLLTTTLLGTSSCEDDHYYEDPLYEATEALSYNIWVDRFRNSDGIDCEQQLVFNNNFTGREIMTFFDPYEPHPIVQTTYFRWEWTNSFLDEIYIRYEDGFDLYFEDVNIGYHHLSGYWDGTYVQFKALE